MSQRVSACVGLWNKVTPHLDSEPDYSLSEVEIKKLYLTQTLPDLKETLDKADDSFVNGIWEVKQPASESKKTDRQKEYFKDARNTTTPSSLSDRYEASRKSYLDSRVNQKQEAK